jgi:hypothetical protein
MGQYHADAVGSLLSVWVYTVMSALPGISSVVQIADPQSQTRSGITADGVPSLSAPKVVMLSAQIVLNGRRAL